MLPKPILEPDRQLGSLRKAFETLHLNRGIAYDGKGAAVLTLPATIPAQTSRYLARTPGPDQGRRL
jgi:hypothetical protein